MTSPRVWWLRELDRITTLTEDKRMRVTFLGTGTSHGIPMIGCNCDVCRSTDPHNQRLRPSIFVETDAVNVLVDATPDFRTQALRAGIRRVDAVLVTHTHADHVLGLDDLRAFTERNGAKMPIYCSRQSMADLQRVFPYACTDQPAWPGLPSFLLHPLEPNSEIELAHLRIRALPLPHGKMIVYGFLFDRDLAYVTDCHEVPGEVLDAIRGVTLLVVDALRHRPHPTHLTVAQALKVVAQVQPRRALLTHLCHELDHQKTESELPASVRIAYDGQTMEIKNDGVRQLN